MLALGKLLELTLAGREPTEKIQLTLAGTRLHWLAEGALEITPAADLDSGLDLLERFLAYSPKDRITAKDSLNHLYFDDLDKENI